MARYGRQYGACGMLVTDWGDFGHVNDPRMAIPGMIIGAQESWNPTNSDEADMLRRISRLEYHDASGELLIFLRMQAMRPVSNGAPDHLAGT